MDTHTKQKFYRIKHLDNGQMVYDFGLTKIYIKEIIDSFDHAITLWSRDDKRYIDDIKRHSLRWTDEL